MITRMPSGLPDWIRVPITTGINRLHLGQISRPKSSQFCRMEFEKSSQAKSWIFSIKSLADCKRRAVSMDCELHNRTNRHNRITNRVRKFASGYHKRVESAATPLQLPNPSLRHQEILMQFHSHQIQFLIGPNAVLYDLRTSERVLSTAIMFFRRFYMSNSVVEISPRKISAACAFFAAKVEEEKVEVRTVSWLIAYRFISCSPKISSAASLCGYVGTLVF
jgi:Cyclin, N-terminal domain